MLDAIIRAGLIVAHRVLRVWWFIRRPPVHGAFVIVRRRARSDISPAAEGEHEWEWLLIANSYKSGWVVPCGGIKRGEQARAAARRELREEVGLDVPEERLVEVGEVELEYQWRADHARFFELTLGDDETPEVRIDRREVIEARFVRVSRISELEIAPHLAWYLAQQAD